MLTKSYSYFTAVLLSTMIFALAGCGGTSTTQSGQGAISAKLVWNNKTVGKSVASAPVGVAKVRLAISGSGMTTIQHDFPAADGNGTLNYIPVGSGLTVSASGLDSSGTIIYEGSVGNVAVQSGMTTDVGTITMTAVTPALFTTAMISGKSFSYSDTMGQSGSPTFNTDGSYTDTNMSDTTNTGTWSINTSGQLVIDGTTTMTLGTNSGTVITAAGADPVNAPGLSFTVTFTAVAPTAAITGVWRSTNGPAFSYLALFADNTFMYGENDPTAPAGDNGVEVGTYTNDGTNITFTVTYDRNGPGQNSGIGEAGIPKVIDYTLSNNGNTITVAGGQLKLNRSVFSSTSLTGAWRSVNGAAFSYLILFNDSTVLYAENDLTVQSITENGLEVGTYTYDGANLTANLVYDDNLSIGGSGLGTIGTPGTISATLSNNGTTLTAAGQLVLTRTF
ncbi:MAG: hypothetical protein A2076_05400 [Geobacteraceae bacterium GWC2_53_11]|nr:MAG: hypothetical protein A2076_05400 [Geobacteraceae bacterium GWC2_53_11]